MFLYKDEHNKPFWATAGGELKDKETFLEAAKRELYEETGLSVEIGEMLRGREAVYAVARSKPAKWIEKYFLVMCHSSAKIFQAEWTDEEKSTIQEWKWWSLHSMETTNRHIFKPSWLPKLLLKVHKEKLNA